jgi:hypothetical protein
VAVSLKASAATVAALFTLFAGVGVAQAGLPGADATDEIAGITGAQGDGGLGGLLGDGDQEDEDGGLLDGLLGDGKGDDDGAVGDVLDDATGVVDDTLDGAGDVVDDAKSGLDETVAGAKDALDETVSGANEAVEDIVDDTPAGGVVDDVKRRIDPVVDVVEQVSGAAGTGSASASRGGPEVSVESAAASSAPQARQPHAASESAAAGTAQNTSHNAKNSPLSSALLEEAAKPRGAPTLQLTVSAAARLDGGSAATPHNRLQATPFGQPPGAPMDAEGNEDSSSSQAPALPFGPLFPVDLPATAAAGGGAAGSALTVALLCALMLLAPRSGRLARPGPNLVGPEPCLSLPERPG